MLRHWDIVYVDDVVDDGPGGDGPQLFIQMGGDNLLMINPSLAAVDGREHALIRELERRGIDVMPLWLRHARPLGGGFNCVTLRRPPSRDAGVLLD